MRILLINHFPLQGSGSGVYVHNIAKSLTQRGHQVCIIMPENTTKIDCSNNIKIHPVFFKREEIIDGQLEFNFPCMDPHPRSNFLFHEMNNYQIEQYEKAFRKAIEEEISEFKPDVIHTQHIWIISGLLNEYKIPYIITSHGAEFITYKKTNIFDKYGINAAEGCKKLITISDENTNKVINKFPNVKDKIIYIKNGYNSKDFYMKNVEKKDVLEKFEIYGDFEKIVLFVGRVSKMKGLDTLFKAAKIYENDNVLTLIAGDGSYRPELEKMKKELELKNIIFLGNKTQSELNDLYNISDVLVLPSRSEALPLVAIESLACGTPAVITNLPGIDNIITKDVGLTFEMDNEKMLANQINKIINKEIVFDKDIIINNAKNNYSQERLIDKLIELYEEIKET